jgi:hypothetical protein
MWLIARVAAVRARNSLTIPARIAPSKLSATHVELGDSFSLFGYVSVFNPSTKALSFPAASSISDQEQLFLCALNRQSQVKKL